MAKRADYLLILFLFHLLQGNLFAALKADCPYLLSEIWKVESLKPINPSDQMAVQSMLEEIFKNPDMVLSKAHLLYLEKDWPKELDLGAAIELMRKLGKEHQQGKWKFGFKDTWNAFKARMSGDDSVEALTVILGPGAVVVLATVILAIQQSNFKQARHASGGVLANIEDKLSFSLHIGNKEDLQDLQWLKEVLECDPLQDEKSFPRRIASVIAKSEQQPSPSEVIAALTFKKDDGVNDQERELRLRALRRLREQSGVVLCTNWGHPAEELFDAEVVKELDQLLLDLKQMFPGNHGPKFHQIVRLKAKFEKPSPFKGYYIDPQAGRIEITDDDGQSLGSETRNKAYRKFFANQLIPLYWAGLPLEVRETWLKTEDVRLEQRLRAIEIARGLGGLGTSVWSPIVMAEAQSKLPPVRPAEPPVRNPDDPVRFVTSYLQKRDLIDLFRAYDLPQPEPIVTSEIIGHDVFGTPIRSRKVTPQPKIFIDFSAGEIDPRAEKAGVSLLDRDKGVFQYRIEGDESDFRAALAKPLAEHLWKRMSNSQHWYWERQQQGRSNGDGRTEFEDSFTRYFRKQGADPKGNPTTEAENAAMIEKLLGLRK